MGVTHYPYRADECEDLPAEELEAYLDQFSRPEERVWMRDENPLWFWTWMFNLKRNCDRLERGVPQWLESLLEEAPVEALVA